MIEFVDAEIEALQRQNAERLGFLMTGHMLRLTGICRTCVDALKKDGRLADVLAEFGVT